MKHNRGGLETQPPSFSLTDIRLTKPYLMKRLLLSSILTTLLITGATAAPVSRNAAMASAEKFLETKWHSSIHKTSSRKKLKKENRSSSYSSYYIFNVENEGGFIVVSGDDRARTILAYSDKGSISETDMPDACRFWLNHYSKEISALVAGEISNIDILPTASQTEAIAPLIQTKWDQKYPYNIFCPTESNGMRCVTGCVATATAQVMRYYSHPAQATGTITYDDNAQQTRRTLDFSTIDPFDWDNMTLTYNYNSSEIQCNAVANLMKAVGYGVKMQYSPYTSLAYHRSVGEALINYFGYDKNLHLYERDLMTAKEWEKIILDELNAGRPIVYEGRNPEIGHDFICDGYDGNHLFHFNWGWSGLSDGYFSLSALNPNQQSTGGSSAGYNDSQAIICRIAPVGKIESLPQTSFLMTIYTLYLRDATAYHKAAETTSLKTTLSDGQFFFDCVNKGFYDFTGEIWAAIVDDNKIKPIIRSNAGTIAGGSYGRLSFPLADADLNDGTYTIGFFYRLNDTDEWHRVTASPDQPIECTLTIKGTEVTLSPLKQHKDEESGIESTLINNKTEITIFDLNGRKIQTIETLEEDKDIDISSLPDGIYILRIKTSEGIKTRKIII